MAGGAFGLIGWWFTRRYGGKGLVLFLIGWTAWGVIHDFGGALVFASSNLIQFAPGPVPVVADAALYASCGALAQGVIRLAVRPGRTFPGGSQG